MAIGECTAEESELDIVRKGSRWELLRRCKRTESMESDEDKS